MMVAGAGSIVALFSCGHDEQPAGACINVAASCSPAYEPTFDNVFRNTLKPSCALAGPSCHAAAGMKAGLVLEDVDTAFRLLGERGRAVPGDPQCSLVTRRIESSDVGFMMPPGLPLPPGEKCAIVQWVAHGAQR